MTEPTFFYEAKGQVLVIHLPKELDHHNCRNLRYETDLLLSENYITRMVFDFSRTVFMDSSGIGILLNRYKQMQRSGGSVAIYGVGVQINRILNLGGIWNLINGFSSKEKGGWLQKKQRPVLFYLILINLLPFSNGDERRAGPCAFLSAVPPQRSCAVCAADVSRGV